MSKQSKPVSQVSTLLCDIDIAVTFTFWNGGHSIGAGVSADEGVMVLTSFQAPDQAGFLLSLGEMNSRS